MIAVSMLRLLFFLLVIMIGFKKISLMSWNIRGAASDAAKRHLKEYVSFHKPTCIILVETHVCFSKVQRFWNLMGYSVIHIVEARGQAGGIWCLTSNKDLNFDVIDANDQAITCKISHGRSEWWCSAIYASPIPLVRLQFWDYLGNLRSVVKGPWMLVGDFNEVLLPSKVRGGSFYSMRALKVGDVLDNCSLVDLGFKGPAFMWHRSMQGGQKISKRLDRAVANCDWRLAFIEASFLHLHRMYSDHNPLLFKLL